MQPNAEQPSPGSQPPPDAQRPAEPPPFHQYQQPTTPSPPHEQPNWDYIYRPRPNPWPWIAVGVALVAMVWAGYVWMTDSSEVNTKVDTEKRIELDAEGGLTTRDLNACRAFHTMSLQASTTLGLAVRPDGQEMAGTENITDGIVDDYLAAAETVKVLADDKKMVTAMETLEKDLGPYALVPRGTTTTTPESTPTTTLVPPQVQRFQAVSKAVDKFATVFEGRCSDGGLLIRVAP